VKKEGPGKRHLENQEHSVGGCIQTFPDWNDNET